MFENAVRPNACIIFDIDDTLITNGRPIQHTVDLMKDLSRMGITVFVITARMKGRSYEERTVRQMSDIGLTPDTYTKLFMMPKERYMKQSMEEVSKYKYDCRKKIRRKYFIVANIGDMFSDHFRLPCNDRLYLISRCKSQYVIFINPIEKNACLKMVEKKTP